MDKLKNLPIPPVNTDTIISDTVKPTKEKIDSLKKANNSSSVEKEDDEIIFNEEELDRVFTKEPKPDSTKQNTEEEEEVIFQEADLDNILNSSFIDKMTTIDGGKLDITTNPNKYPFQLRIGEDNDKLRALSQTSWDQFGNFVAQSVLDGIVGQSIGAVGSVGGIGEAIVDYANNRPADFNNTLIEWSNAIKGYSKDQFPIYKENPSTTFDFGDFAWWDGRFNFCCKYSRFIRPRFTWS